MGASKSTSETRPGFTYLDQDVQDIVNQAMQWFGGQFGEAGATYGGEFMPLLSGNMQRISEMGSRYEGGDTFGAAGEMERTLGGDYLMPESNPFLRANVGAALGDLRGEWENVTQPAVMNAAKRAGALYSSEMPQQMTRAGDLYNRRAGDVVSGMYGEAYESERDRMMKGLEMAPGLGMAPYAEAEAAYGLAAKPWEAQAGQNIMQYEDWVRAEGERTKMMEQMSRLLAAILGGPSGGDTTTTGPSPWNALVPSINLGIGPAPK